MTPRTLVAVLLVVPLLAVIPSACVARSTYPPTAGRSISKPSVSPGPEVMAGSIKEAHRVSGGAGEVVFNLPAGLDANTWKLVTKLLPAGARAMKQGDERVYSVQQLRIDGGRAEVDVVYPDRGVYQLMTVSFEGGPFLAWKPRFAHRWVIPATPPMANDPMIAIDAAAAAAAITTTASETGFTIEVVEIAPEVEVKVDVVAPETAAPEAPQIPDAAVQPVAPSTPG